MWWKNYISTDVIEILLVGLIFCSQKQTQQSVYETSEGLEHLNCLLVVCCSKIICVPDISFSVTHESS
jgi:hypothetical protein